LVHDPLLPNTRSECMSIDYDQPQIATDISNDEWQQLLQNVSPELRFLDRHWYNVWGQSYAANDNSIVATANYAATTSDDNATLGIFPCALRNLVGIKVLTMAGYYDPFRTFLCPSGREADAIDYFLTTIVEQGDIAAVYLGPIPVDSLVSIEIERSFSSQRWMLSKVDLGAQQIVHLPDTLDTFRASLSRNLCKNHDRRKRQLAELGNLEIRHYNACSEERWCMAIEHCSTIEANSWLVGKKSGATRVFQQEEFWQHYVSCREASRRLSAWVVYLSEIPIAYSLALDAGGCRYSISGQYDKAYRKYGVGIIADMAMFEDAIENGFDVVNMNDGEAEYKKRWGARAGSTLQTWYLFKPGTIGKLLYTAFKSTSWLRSLAFISAFQRIGPN